MRVCKNCKSPSFRTENKTFKNGSEHIARYCLQCGAFNDYAAKEFPAAMFVMPFGKYKGLSLQQVVDKDRGYAQWMANVQGGKVLGKRLREVMRETPTIKDPVVSALVAALSD